jgi:hypothetical protein
VLPPEQPSDQGAEKLARTARREGPAVLVEETCARTRRVRIGSVKQEGSRKMRSNRRKNWFIKRIALGLAIAAVAAPVAQARVDEGIQGQPNAVNESFKPIPYRWPSSADEVVLKGVAYQPFVTDFPSPQVNASDYGMPRAMPVDYAVNRGDQIEVIRALPSGSPSDKIEFVRTQPRSIGEPEIVSASFDWKDAGIGAGLVLALVLLGGGAALASRHVGRAQTV